MIIPTHRSVLVAFATLLLIHAARAADREVVVAADGSGDYRTVQAAVDAAPDAAPDASDSDGRTVVRIRPGTYEEKLDVPRGKGPLVFLGGGKSPDETVLTYSDNASTLGPDGENVGTTGSTSVMISADDFTAENLTFANSAGDTGQAVAVKTNGDRVAFFDCRFLGWQDTLYPNGARTYFKDCHIEGSTDFIFGRATAVFESCTILSKKGSYITDASTEAESPFGFVFLNCKLVSATGEPTYLGRPWRDHAAVAFIDSELGGHIRAEGWHNWNKPDAEATVRYVEHGNTGPGANLAGRVSWATELPAEQAARYTPLRLLAGDDGWHPERCGDAGDS